MTRVHRIAALTVGALTATYAAGAERNAYFGDLHIHTRFSTDAYSFGTRASPDDAYRYARGESMKHPAGYEIQLDRALDFYAVTDHASYLGTWSAMSDPDHPLAQDPEARRFLDAKTVDEKYAAFRTGSAFLRAHPDPEASRSAWRETIASAQRHYEPGQFTTFVAYEYTTGHTEGGHRNVIFRANAPELPFSRLDSPNPEDLWDWLDGLRAEGIEALAIPHNSNITEGRKFARQQHSGEPFDAAYAELRMRNEPLVEVTQVKGTSETHPMLSPTDEWADFELEIRSPRDSPLDKVRGSYVRDAYLTGLEFEEEEGFNPYKFGMVGASDSHNAAASYTESSHISKLGILDGTPERARVGAPGGCCGLGRRVANGGSRSLELGVERFGLGGGVGRGEHARIDLRCVPAAKRPSPPPDRACACASSAATSSATMRSRAAIWWPRPTSTACRWVPTSQPGGVARRNSSFGQCRTPSPRSSSVCR